MIEVRRVRGDDEVARAFVAAMEAWVTEHFGPTTSTVAASEMAPPGGTFVVVYEDGQAVAGGGLRRLVAVLGAGELRLGRGTGWLGGVGDPWLVGGFTNERAPS